MKMVALGDIATWGSGGTPSRSVREYFGDGLPWLSIADLNDGPVGEAKESLTELGLRNSSAKVVPAGSLLVAMYGSIGKLGIATRELCTSQAIAFAIPDEDFVHTRYLFHFLLAQRRSLLALGRGGTQMNIGQGDLKSWKMPLPRLPEQRRIAEVLDRADALRAKRRAALAQLDSLTQSIFLDMFGDPVVNRKGWPLKKLGQVGTLDRGVSKHRPRNAPHLLGGRHPLVQTGEVANCDAYIRSYSATYSDAGLRQSKLWPAGTLCITIAANIAKTGILTFDACFPDSVVGFTANDPATVQFVRVWLSFLQKTLEASAPESAQKNINLAILRNLDIPLPPLDLQHTFAKRITAIEKLKATHRIALTELDALFASLQHRAFRGEL